MTRGEGLLSSSPSPGSWVPHPMWLCLCGMGPMGKTCVPPKMLQNVKQLSAACVGWPCCQQLAAPHTTPWLPGKGQCATCIPGEAQCACTGWVSITPLTAFGLYGSNLSSLYLLLSPTQPPVSPHPAKMRRQQVCLRQTPQSYICHLLVGYMEAQKPVKKYVLAKGRLLPPPAY